MAYHDADYASSGFRSFRNAGVVGKSVETRIGTDVLMLTLGKLADGIGVDATAVAVGGAWLTNGPAWIIETSAVDASGACPAALLSTRNSGRAANFLVYTCTVATGVVATYGTGGTAFWAAFRITTGADAFFTIPMLDTRTGVWFWSRGRAPRGRGVGR